MFVTEKMNIPFKFDCAYKYKSSSNEVKLGLFEVDISNKLILSQTANGIRVKVFPLVETSKSFEAYGINDMKILKTLKHLQLDLRSSSICYIEEAQLKPLEPILLIHVRNFIDGHIMFREGMDGIYGIEQVKAFLTVSIIYCYFVSIIGNH